MNAIDQVFKAARKRIIIIGINPLAPELEESARLLTDLLLSNEDLHIDVFYESESENFSQSLLNVGGTEDPRLSYTYLETHRRRVVGGRRGENLRTLVEGLLTGEVERVDLYVNRLRLWQVNTRMPVDILQVDDAVYIAIVGTRMPTCREYVLIETGNALRGVVDDLVAFYAPEELGGKFLSAPGDELIEMYDRQGIPRGIFPRKCFYTTEYQRASVWGFVFNRHGQLLLHRRSRETTDNSFLWDKSFGGHLDIRDTSSSITAKRELVEELFLPQAEFTKYTRAEVGDFIDFGAWLPEKRPEHSLRGAFEALGRNDWVMFRAASSDGTPLTITRISKRRVGSGKEIRVLPTVFRSDVFLFIAPRGLLDTSDQMKALVSLAEQEGAAADHRLVSVGELRHWIQDCNAASTADETFTDDLLAIDLEHSYILEGFAEFVRFAFREDN